MPAARRVEKRRNAAAARELGENTVSALRELANDCFSACVIGVDFESTNNGGTSRFFRQEIAQNTVFRSIIGKTLDFGVDFRSHFASSLNGVKLFSCEIFANYHTKNFVASCDLNPVNMDEKTAINTNSLKQHP